MLLPVCGNDDILKAKLIGDPLLLKKPVLIRGMLARLNISLTGYRLCQR